MMEVIETISPQYIRFTQTLGCKSWPNFGETKYEQKAMQSDCKLCVRLQQLKQVILTEIRSLCSSSLILELRATVKVITKTYKVNVEKGTMTLT
ncbi:unnamed protein product [Paramecium primaurelia]|uniref:Uncharacterized protein n=1 Tax=Paramecium primaurelia TaxID=5886 RepID=A0A8S1NBC5_PARPR|nr:unnamed protein product [Paramecium primaurelia]CAD8089918.1 unnamed protein product [Paramecium primaurelia]